MKATPPGTILPSVMSRAGPEGFKQSGTRTNDSFSRGVLVVPAVWRSGRDVGFLAVWLGVGLILTRLPLGFERKLAWGLQIPQSLLSALLAAWLMRSMAGQIGHAWLRRAVAVAHGHRDRVHARPEPDEPLVDHALVGAQGFLKGADANHLIAHELAHRRRIAAEGDLDVVLGDELVAVAPEAQGMVRERQRKHGEGGVGRGSAEIPNRRDEGQRRAGDDEAHRAVHLPRVGQRRHDGAGLGLLHRPGWRGRPAADGGGDGEEDEGRESSHLLNLKSER